MVGRRHRSPLPARAAVRRSTAGSVDRASQELEQRLPAPVRRALDVLPADAVRAGGTAIVAGRTARRAATTTRRASRAANGHRRRLAEGVRRVRSIGDEIGQEAELRRRQLTSDYLRSTDDHARADEVLLDRRIDGAEPALPELTAPTRPGRWRARRQLGAGSVERVQRSYRPRTRPWD